jgi:hypothetical protein
MELKKKVISLIDGRTKFLTAKVFELVERKLPQIIRSKEWIIIRNDILDISNNIMRANHEDLNKYDIIQKSIKIEKNNKISFASSIFYLVNRLTFNFQNLCMEFTVPTEKNDLLNGIYEELKSGEIIDKGENKILRFDRNSILQNLDVFDKLPLKVDTMNKYNDFRKKIINSYWLDVKECNHA